MNIRAPSYSKQLTQANYREQIKHLWKNFGGQAENNKALGKPQNSQ